jgi:secreted trypsin-like serine protease
VLQGDSGGPLFCQYNDYRYRLVGVASYVHVGCNKPEKPVVYTDAIRYNQWIANNTSKLATTFILILVLFYFTFAGGC